MSDEDEPPPILEIPAELPPDGRQVWYFPGARDHGQADVIARVYRRDGSSWIACLTRTDWMFVGVTPEALVLPCNERVLLCAGVADRDDPTSWRRLCVEDYFLVYWTPDRDAVVFCDGLSIEVFGREGPLWHAEHLAEMGIESVSSELIVCSIYNPASGEYIERRFDLRTGLPQE